MSFRALCTLDFGRICALATAGRNVWPVEPGNEPGFDDILWKAKSSYKMWQLLHSILNVHTSTEAVVLEIETRNKKIKKNSKTPSPPSLLHSLNVPGALSFGL